jgi:MATE family multidrug resistance protein
VAPRGTVLPHHAEDQTGQEWQQGLEEERSLLADNGIIFPSRPDRRRSTTGRLQSQFSGLLSQGLKQADEEAVVDAGPDVSEGTEATETTALLGHDEAVSSTPSDGSGEAIDQKWEEAVRAGLIHTTWQRELKVLGRYTGPLMVTFVLQNSLTVASIFTVGHLGKVQLGAVSLGSMSASITGFAVYQGLATSLDTLCAQAYGSGRKELVGLHTQRMIYFLWVITIPIGLLWLFADKILTVIVPEPEVARLAGQYLKIVLIGAPGYACFEAGKRYVQAQGLFTAALLVLLTCAPLNAFMNWLFVWVSACPPHGLRCR